MTNHQHHVLTLHITFYFLILAAGLKNLGNTCYMNAVVQALAHSSLLLHAVYTGCHSQECRIAFFNQTKQCARDLHSLADTADSAFCTLCEIENLMRRVHSQPTENFVPDAFVSGFLSNIAHQFEEGVQQDAHEFLQLLIDSMQNSCKDARAAASAAVASRTGGNANSVSSEDDEYPFRLFGGSVETHVTCSCGKMSCSINRIEDIGLDIRPVGSVDGSSSDFTNMPLANVTQALDKFISPEQLDYKCEQCEKRGKATKTSKIASIPPILILHLKRFQTSGDKILGHVGFGSVLEFNPYLIPQLQHSNASFGLFAVVVHISTESTTGHYIAYVRNVTKDDEWWKMDDAEVLRTTWDEVRKADAYILLYQDMSQVKNLPNVTSSSVNSKLKIQDTSIMDSSLELARGKKSKLEVRSIFIMCIIITYHTLI